MRLKKLTALMLSAVILSGVLGYVQPVRAYAASGGGTYGLTVPANPTIGYAGWNYIGEVNVILTAQESEIETFRKPENNQCILVTAENGFTGRKLKDQNQAEKISYELKLAKDDNTEGDAIPTTGIFFGNIGVTNEGGQSVKIGAVVNAEDYGNAADGSYTDTVTFKAAVAPVLTGTGQAICGQNTVNAWVTDKDAFCYFPGSGIEFEDVYGYVCTFSITGDLSGGTRTDRFVYLGDVTEEYNDQVQGCEVNKTAGNYTVTFPVKVNGTRTRNGVNAGQYEYRIFKVAAEVTSEVPGISKVIYYLGAYRSMVSV